MAFLSGRPWARLIALALVCGGGTRLEAGPAAKGRPPAIVSTHAMYAAFTLNLTRFVSWPEHAFADAGAPLVIGTFPRDPINAHLDAAVPKEKFNDRPIRAVRIQTLKDVEKCHVIFISRSDPRQAAVLERTTGKPILTISDADGFLERGGHVLFTSQPPRTKLRVSVDNLKTSGLTSRSQLLRLATQ